MSLLDSCTRSLFVDYMYTFDQKWDCDAQQSHSKQEDHIL